VVDQTNAIRHDPTKLARSVIRAWDHRIGSQRSGRALERGFVHTA